MYGHGRFGVRELHFSLQCWHLRVDQRLSVPVRGWLLPERVMLCPVHRLGMWCWDVSHRLHRLFGWCMRVVCYIDDGWLCVDDRLQLRMP